MIRVKILKDYKKFKKDEVQYLSPNEAFGLIDKGVAMVSKEMTVGDTRVTTGYVVPTVMSDKVTVKKERTKKPE